MGKKEVRRRECWPLSCKCGKEKYFPQRVLAALITFFVVSASYMNRVLFIFVVPLISKSSSDCQVSHCPDRIPIIQSIANPIDISMYNWNNKDQSKLIGSYYYGYPLLMIASAYIVTVYGAKWILTLSLAVSSACTICTPFLLNKGGDGQVAYWGCFGIRIVQGAFEGAMFCNINGIISGWIPKEERGSLGYIIFCGPHIGTFCGFFIAGQVISKYGLWQELFWIYGGYGLFCCLLFICFTHSTFEKHPFITNHEYEYLKENMPPLEVNKKIPCRRIARCMPFWSLLLTSMVYDFVFFSIQNELPKYMKTMLGFNTNELSIFTAVPYLFTMLIAIVCGSMSDNLLRRAACSITTLRKIFVVIGIMVPGIFALGAASVKCDNVLVILMFVIAVAGMGFYSAGWANYCDLSPGFAALLTAMANTITACQGFISSLIVSAIVGAEPTFAKWQIFMGLVLGYATVASIGYLIFGSGLRQQWDIDAVGQGQEKDKKEDIQADPKGKKS